MRDQERPVLESHVQLEPSVWKTEVKRTVPVRLDTQEMELGAHLYQPAVSVINAVLNP